MPTISFFRQQRRDGGIRTGLSVDLDVVWHHLQEGPDDSDPALLWFVDVRCEGKRVPRDAAGVQRWFHAHGETIKKGLRNAAQELRAGMDFNSWPLQWPIKGTPVGTRATLVCSAARRLDAIDIATLLTDLAQNWQTYLAQLDHQEAVRA